MKYNTNFHAFQKAYTTKYPGALRMRSYLPNLKGKTILDVGCGSGIDIAYFITLGAKRVAGTDISHDLVSIAKEIAPTAEVRNETFAYLSWKDETFDVVWSKYALNCAEDIVVPLKEISRVLKKDGTALLQVTHPFRSLQYLKTKDYFDEKTSIEYPTTDGKQFIEPHHMFSSWINAINEAGFKIIKCEEVLNRPKKEYTGIITPSSIIFVLKK